MDEELTKINTGRQMSQVGWVLLVYQLIINVAVVAAVALEMAFTGVTGVQAVSGNGWGYAAASVLAVLLIILWKGRSYFASLFTAPQRKMTVGAFLTLLTMLLLGQGVFAGLSYSMEWIFNRFGLSVTSAVQAASDLPDTFSIFLYTALLAPVVEEIVFRGVLLKMLRPFGKVFAILMSAFLFGAFHGNMVQSPFAFILGLVLGYVSVEYSVGWAILIHMTNNLILGDVLSWVTDLLPQALADQLYMWLIGGGFLTAVVILIIRRREIADYCRSNPIQPLYVKAFFRSVSILCFVALMTISALTWITHI